MPTVRSLLSYEEFLAGRSVSNAVHREDRAVGYVVGDVDEARDGDEEITEAVAATERQAIRDYNAAIPVPPEPPPSLSRDAALEAALEDTATIADMKTALLDWVKQR